MLIDAFVQLQLLQDPFISCDQASKAALPCCMAPTREATTTGFPAIGKTRKKPWKHGASALPRAPIGALELVCVLGVF